MGYDYRRFIAEDSSHLTSKTHFLKNSTQQFIFHSHTPKSYISPENKPFSEKYLGYEKIFSAFSLCLCYLTKDELYEAKNDIFEEIKEFSLR